MAACRPDARRSAFPWLPFGTFWMSGHHGQSAMLVPSMGIAVIRLGLTPPRLGYRPQLLGRRVVDLFG